jgi:serine/threonine protein kinase
VLGLIAIASTVSFVLRAPKPPQQVQPVRLSAEIGVDASLYTAYGPAAILSPDGRRLALVASGSDQKRRIYVRSLDQLQATALSGTENARDLFFSPDGQWLGFFADAKMKKISVSGGAAVTLCDVPDDLGGSWGEDGTIVFSPNATSALSKVSSAGGTPQPLTTLDSQAGEVTQRWPQLLPGAKAVLSMAILSGKRLGPYEILSAIGAGGMGEVYRARDTRLERIVAVKILPDHLSDRAELRERFEREARTVASLNHPHICTLHDIGQQDGTDFLVMEYLEGETLAERLKKGPLPLDQVLQYAIEISDALDKAHRKGITHRDLKPGNIMLTKSGTKLLDFGLAKLRQDAAPDSPLSQLPTANKGITAQGTIVGTLQYMAPEQLEGKEVDARTDIFAFGVVVYEMATGKKAFEGKSQASLIAKILETDPPPMSSLQPMTPPALDRVVKKCLAKEPDDRWHAAKDLCDELKWIAESGSQIPSQMSAPVKGIRALGLGRRPTMVGVATLLCGAVIASLAIWNLKPAPPSPPRSVTRTVITLPPGQQLAGLDRGPAVALSPDGTHLAYVAREGGTQQIYLRPMDGLEARSIPGTEGATEPFFSPDGPMVGVFRG